MNRALPVAVLLFIALTGCTAAVEGEPVGTVGGGARSVVRMLPDRGELSAVIGARMQFGNDGAAGGTDLRDLDSDDSAGGCLGVKRSGARRAYPASHIRDAVANAWETVNTDPHFNVHVAVVELDSVDDAQAAYSRITAQWQQCRGKTVYAMNPAGTERLFAYQFTRVDGSEGMLTANVMQSTVNLSSQSTPSQRALTAVSQYLVDADVYSMSWRTGDPIVTDNAEAVAHLIASKIDSSL
ncbi:sensor domain-containing protein [Mycobacteroides abscessus]|uniref:sensor domain-containing protein n=1 Tax=Mycobacteroides abscessus TaxID=36809 RepID=UPI001D1477A5|nr:sensor domain-containing protein [Mycobacteroides abscessus]UEA50380.1 sensor domain-containing protein [Mycobacteroides abscessus subsp. abscessus]UEA53812.1 sensor domain-containing protein [Mycobacteroides abscessus]